MSGNGGNIWGVAYSRITFLQKILSSHDNILSTSRHDDIVFEVTRRRLNDNLTVVCVDEYTASLELVMRVIAAFPSVSIIFVGGKWNGFTWEAYDFCRKRKIGIYNAGELSGALSKADYWDYEKFDERGDSEKGIRA